MLNLWANKYNFSLSMSWTNYTYHLSSSVVYVLQINIKIDLIVCFLYPNLQFSRRIYFKQYVEKVKSYNYKSKTQRKMCVNQWLGTNTQSSVTLVNELELFDQCGRLACVLGPSRSSFRVFCSILKEWNYWVRFWLALRPPVSMSIKMKQVNFYNARAAPTREC